MSLYEFNIIVSGYTIIIAVIIGMFRFKRIVKSARPFIYFLFIAFGNELLTGYAASAYHSNAINGNIYVLIEFLVLIWLFRNWGAGQRNVTFYYKLGMVGLSVWVLDTLILHSISHFSSVYRICYSFIIIFLSIDEINHIIISEKRNILTNPRFIICITFVAFFAYKAFLEAFFLMDLNLSHTFYGSLLLISAFLNLLANLIYAVAVLCMPTKQKYFLPYYWEPLY